LPLPLCIKASLKCFKALSEKFSALALILSIKLLFWLVIFYRLFYRVFCKNRTMNFNWR
jgi:uncharacterized membrane protein (DUF485 family)